MISKIVASAIILLAATALSAQTPDLYYTYNDGTGSTAANDGTAGAAGTFSSTPTWLTPGQIGTRAVNFGTGNEMTTGYSPAAGLSGDWTMETWIRTTHTELAEVVGSGSFTTGNIFYWYLQSSGTVSFFCDDQAATAAVRWDGTVAVNDGNWHHIAIVYDSATPTFTMYVNGVADTGAAIGNGALPILVGATSLVVGDGSLATVAGSNDWVGDLDDLRVWSVARSAAEISANYGIELGQTTPEIGVFDPNSDTVADGGTHRIDPVAPGGNGTYTWTIQNLHPTVGLNIGTVVVTATAGCTVTITTDPSSTTVTGGSTTALSVQVTGNASPGVATFTITIPSNDADENPYNITVNGSRGLSGTLSVISGGGGDYTDIGDAFDDLEDFGVVGATIIEVTGANFTSAPSYELGSDAGVEQEVLGTSATNTIIVRPATGQSPIIDGAGITFGLNGFNGGIGVMFTAVSFFTFEGFEIDGGGISGGCDAGILYWAEAGLFDSSNVTIRGNIAWNIGAGNGIVSVYNFGTGLDTHVIENNMSWDLGHTIGTFGNNFTGGICMFRPTATCVVQHNTVMATATFFAVAPSCCFQGLGGGTNLGNFDFNIAYNNISNAPCIKFDDGATTPTVQAPTAADRNVYYFPNGIMSDTQTSLANWQSQTGLDANSLNADPSFVSASATYDLHLGTVSPAYDLAVGSTLTTDIDGDTRPNGTVPDAGADEGTGSASGGTITITNATLPNGIDGIAYSETLTATTTAPTGPTYTWSVSSGTLPTGLTLAASTTTSVVLSGTPSAAGTYIFDITCSDGTASGTEGYTVIIAPAGSLIITTTSLSDGVTLSAYSENIVSIGGTGTLTWTVLSGTLPPGLTPSGSTNNTETLSGTPSLANTYNFTLEVSDGTNSDTQAFSVTITSGSPIIGGGGGGGGGGGCTVSTTGVAWIALLGLLAVAFVGLRRRREE